MSKEKPLDLSLRVPTSSGSTLVNVVTSTSSAIQSEVVPCTANQTPIMSTGSGPSVGPTTHVNLSVLGQGSLPMGLSIYPSANLTRFHVDRTSTTNESHSSLRVPAAAKGNGISAIGLTTSSALPDVPFASALSSSSNEDFTPPAFIVPKLTESIPFTSNLMPTVSSVHHPAVSVFQRNNVVDPTRSSTAKPSQAMTNISPNEDTQRPMDAILESESESSEILIRFLGSSETISLTFIIYSTSDSSVSVERNSGVIKIGPWHSSGAGTSSSPAIIITIDSNSSSEETHLDATLQRVSDPVVTTSSLSRITPPLRPGARKPAAEVESSSTSNSASASREESVETKPSALSDEKVKEGGGAAKSNHSSIVADSLLDSDIQVFMVSSLKNDKNWDAVPSREKTPLFQNPNLKTSSGKFGSGETSVTKLFTFDKHGDKLVKDAGPGLSSTFVNFASSLIKEPEKREKVNGSSDGDNSSQTSSTKQQPGGTHRKSSFNVHSSSVSQESNTTVQNPVNQGICPCIYITSGSTYIAPVTTAKGSQGIEIRTEIPAEHFRQHSGPPSDHIRIQRAVIKTESSNFSPKMPQRRPFYVVPSVHPVSVQASATSSERQANYNAVYIKANTSSRNADLVVAGPPEREVRANASPFPFNKSLLTVVTLENTVTTTLVSNTSHSLATAYADLNSPRLLDQSKFQTKISISPTDGSYSVPPSAVPPVAPPPPAQKNGLPRCSSSTFVGPALAMPTINGRAQKAFAVPLSCQNLSKERPANGASSNTVSHLDASSGAARRYMPVTNQAPFASGIITYTNSNPSMNYISSSPSIPVTNFTTCAVPVSAAVVTEQVPPSSAVFSNTPRQALTSTPNANFGVPVQEVNANAVVLQATQPPTQNPNIACVTPAARTTTNLNSVYTNSIATVSPPSPSVSALYPMLPNSHLPCVPFMSSPLFPPYPVAYCLPSYPPLGLATSLAPGSFYYPYPLVNPTEIQLQCGQSRSVQGFSLAPLVLPPACPKPSKLQANLTQVSTQTSAPSVEMLSQNNITSFRNVVVDQSVTTSGIQASMTTSQDMAHTTNEVVMVTQNRPPETVTPPKVQLQIMKEHLHVPVQTQPGVETPPAAQRAFAMDQTALPRTPALPQPYCGAPLQTTPGGEMAPCQHVQTPSVHPLPTLTSSSTILANPGDKLCTSRSGFGLRNVSNERNLILNQVPNNPSSTPLSNIQEVPSVPMGTVPKNVQESPKVFKDGSQSARMVSGNVNNLGPLRSGLAEIFSDTHATDRFTTNFDPNKATLPRHVEMPRVQQSVPTTLSGFGVYDTSASRASSSMTAAAHAGRPIMLQIANVTSNSPIAERPFAPTITTNLPDGSVAVGEVPEGSSVIIPVYPPSSSSPTKPIMIQLVVPTGYATLQHSPGPSHAELQRVTPETVLPPNPPSNLRPPSIIPPAVAATPPSDEIARAGTDAAAQWLPPAPPIEPTCQYSIRKLTVTRVESSTLCVNKSNENKTNDKPDTK